MREKIYQTIETEKHHTLASKIYSFSSIIIILLSMVPFMFKESSDILLLIDRITVSFFIIDFFLRLLTADYEFPEKKRN